MGNVFKDGKSYDLHQVLTFIQKKLEEKHQVLVDEWVWWPWWQNTIWCFVEVNRRHGKTKIDKDPNMPLSMISWKSSYTWVCSTKPILWTLKFIIQWINSYKSASATEDHLPFEYVCYTHGDTNQACDILCKAQGYSTQNYQDWPNPRWYPKNIINKEQLLMKKSQHDHSFPELQRLLGRLELVFVWWTGSDPPHRQVWS